MKLLYSILFFLLTHFSFSQEKSPILVFEKTTIDYGKITPESSGRKIFKFKNMGNAPLIIQKVKGSCGCVILNFPKKPIMPNEEGEIKIVYNVLKTGRISRTITVTTNTKKPITVLKIKGRVLKNKS